MHAAARWPRSRLIRLVAEQGVQMSLADPRVPQGDFKAPIPK